jgi:hypothetical protein
MRRQRDIEKLLKLPIDVDPLPWGADEAGIETVVEAEEVRPKAGRGVEGGGCSY